MGSIDNAALDAAALSAIASLQATAAAASLPETFSAPPAMAGMAPQMSMAPIDPGAAAQVAQGGGSGGGTQSGTVKSWFEDKGFGFIIPDGGGEDVFVHRHALSDGVSLVQGGTVYFEMQWNAQKGKCSATKCVGAVPSQTGATGAQPPVPVMGQLQSGTVKAWYEDKGFGFIIPQGGGDDVFVHRSSLQDGQVLTATASVMYEVQWNPQKNKYGAMKVYGAAAGSADMGAAGMPGMSVLGGMPGMPGLVGMLQAAPAAGKPPAEPWDNIFVAGLPPGSTDDFLRQIFGPYGNVLDCRVLPDAGRPDRAALIRMGDVEQAKWLVDNLNGNMPTGLTSPLVVRFADRNSGKGGGKGGAASLPPAPPPAAAPPAAMVSGYGPACGAAAWSGYGDGYSPYGAMSAAGYGGHASLYGQQAAYGPAVYGQAACMNGWMEVPQLQSLAGAGCYDHAAAGYSQAAGGHDSAVFVTGAAALAPEAPAATAAAAATAPTALTALTTAATGQ